MFVAVCGLLAGVAVRSAHAAAQTRVPTVTIVTSGTNAPEALLRVVSASPLRAGTQHVVFQMGPCRQASNAKHHAVVTYDVLTRSPLAVNDVYLDVFPKNRHAIRKATPQEFKSFESCRFSNWK